MKRAILVALGTVTVIGSAAALGVAMTPETLAPSRVAYEAALAGIDAARPQALARCDDIAGDGKELCRAQAGAGETIRVADLESSFRRTQPGAAPFSKPRRPTRREAERMTAMHRYTLPVLVAVLAALLGG